MRSLNSAQSSDMGVHAKSDIKSTNARTVVLLSRTVSFARVTAYFLTCRVAVNVSPESGSLQRMPHS